MPIRMVRGHFNDKVNGWTGPSWVPRFFCDHCERIIDDAMQGNAVWLSPTDVQSLETVAPPDLYFVHQGDCDDRLSKRLQTQDASVFWTSLADFPLELANHSTPKGRHPEFGPLVERTPLHPRYKPKPYGSDDVSA